MEILCQQPFSAPDNCATIPVFIGNPILQVFSPPLSPNGNDGGFSNGVYFQNIIKPIISVQVDNSMKKYGKRKTSLDSTILMNGLPLENFGLTADSVGLGHLNYQTLASAEANVGIYQVAVSMDALDPPGSWGFFACSILWIYIPVRAYTIRKCRSVISPRDTSIVYGDKIGDIHFNYIFDDSHIDPATRESFLDSIEQTHLLTMSNAMVLVNPARDYQPTCNPANADFANLALVATNKALAKSPCDY